MRWTDVAAYVRVMRALLRGDEVEWEGQTIRMLHPDGFAAHRPLDVPLLIAADGPKGLAVAGELGDGVFSTMPSTESDAPWRALLISGTVLAEREDAGSERVIDTVGPALARIFHGRYERAGAAGVDSLPGGRRWREVIEAVPRGRRHLAVHEGHLVEVNERDRPAVIAGAGLIPEVTMTATAAEIRARVADLAEAGFTEIAYQPMGPDIPRELEAFAAATSELG
jgi:5,10-methylenetetrahydromethanopterin reductase